jgi:triacylglycerol lipase
MRKIAVVWIAAALIGMVVGPLSAKPRPENPYSVPIEKMDEALACSVNDTMVRAPGDGHTDDKALRAGRSEPVLLVHGTGVNRRLNFEWNYWPALRRAGFAVCWVELPNAALSDIQIAAEYVARAAEVIHDRTGEDVDILGHSQGGLVPRWAIKWFPSGAHVDDYIGLASPNHGTVVADSFVLGCMEACWQMKTTSNFIAALNAGDETPGETDYTSIYTTSDELVQPVGTQELEGGTNILIQAICPGRPVDHVGIVADELTYRLALDAFTNEGPADTARLPEDICAKGQMEDTTTPPPDAFPPAWGDGSFSSEEPPLMPYARS